MEKNIVAEETKIETGEKIETPVGTAEPRPEQRAEPRPEQRGRGGFRSRRNRPGSDGGEGYGEGQQELIEKVVFINRSAKVVKGGRRFNFSALVVVGDRRGRVGVGLGKAGEVADAIRKGGEVARSQMVSVSLKDATLPHEVFCHFGGAKVLLRPASPGTGIIAGKTVRAVLESAGVKDVLSKSLGSKNAANVVKATLNALLSLRLREDIYRGRGLEIKKVPAPQPPQAIPAPAPKSVADSAA
jgi:small subunit ribosomal protein S5